MQKSDFLSAYAQLFDTVEVNYTYYRAPSFDTLTRMATNTHPGFVFTLKATSQMTHDRLRNPDIYEQYASALQPLITLGKLGAILLQFPNSFKLEKANVKHIAFIRECCRGLVSDATRPRRLARRGHTNSISTQDCSGCNLQCVYISR